MSSITLRGIDSNLYRKFKALATLRGITIQEALEEAMMIWIRLNNHIVGEEDIDIIIDYLKRNPAEPFVFKTKERTVKRWDTWAKKKLGITQ